VLAARLEASAELVVRAETRAELAERQADQVTQDVRKAHAEREDARNLASQAREQSARLSGQVDMLQAESKRRDAVEAAQHAENERLRVELEALRARVPGDSGKGR
jgi:chromosome segregation ATPase